MSDKTESSKFNIAKLEALAGDLKSKRVPLDRVTVTDNIVTGLRAIVRNTGLISYHVMYDIDGYKPYLKIGVHDESNPDHLTIPEARDLARTIKALAAKGIDPQEGLHGRLIRELREQGLNWKP